MPVRHSNLPPQRRWKLWPARCLLQQTASRPCPLGRADSPASAQPKSSRSKACNLVMPACAVAVHQLHLLSRWRHCHQGLNAPKHWPANLMQLPREATLPISPADAPVQACLHGASLLTMTLSRASIHAGLPPARHWHRCATHASGHRSSSWQIFCCTTVWELIAHLQSSH